MSAAILRGQTMATTGAEAATGATPILDRLAPLPPAASHDSGARIMWGGMSALCVAVLVALAFWYRHWIRAHVEKMFPGPWNYARVLIVCLSMFLVGVSVTTIHELGHLIVGVCVGFRCSSMFVGPLQFDIPFRLSLN